MGRTTTSVIVALLAVSVAACGPGDGLGRAVEVDFLWVRAQGGKPTAEGGATRARVALAPNPGGSVRVGVFEESPGSIGESWRATVWMAAVMSALATGQELAAQRVTVEANGFIDGPSAGSLMAAAMTAVRLGVPVRSDVTMTGTVNPDGTIGPVGGVPQKVLAALQQGKKVIGYPPGQGRAHDPISGRVVDLRAMAAAHGAKVVEIDDLERAYALLTGQKLDRPAPLSIDDMRLPDGMRAGLTRRCEDWLRRARKDLSTTPAASAPGGPIRELVQQASAHATEAEGYLRRGAVAVAYWHSARTAVEASVAATLTRFYSLASGGKLPQALGNLKRLSSRVDRRFENLTARLVGAEPKGVDSMLALLDALETAVAAFKRVAQGVALYQEITTKAQAMLARPGAMAPAEVANLAAEILKPVRFFAIADIALQVAADGIDLSLVLKGGGKVDEAQQEHLTELFTRAAQANLHYFDHVFLEQLSRRGGATLEQTRLRFAQADEAYFAARAHLMLPQTQLAKVFGPDTELTAAAQLAGALSSFLRSSDVIARYDTFEIEKDPQTGALKRIGRDKLFWRALALAERKAREHAAIARKRTGRVPAMALLSYQTALVYQERPEIEDRLVALEHFWRASVWSQLAANIARR